MTGGDAGDPPSPLEGAAENDGAGMWDMSSSKAGSTNGGAVEAKTAELGMGCRVSTTSLDEDSSGIRGDNNRLDWAGGESNGVYTASLAIRVGVEDNDGKDNKVAEDNDSVVGGGRGTVREGEDKFIGEAGESGS